MDENQERKISGLTAFGIALGIVSLIFTTIIVIIILNWHPRGKKDNIPASKELFIEYIKKNSTTNSYLYHTGTDDEKYYMFYNDEKETYGIIVEAKGVDSQNQTYEAKFTITFPNSYFSDTKFEYHQLTNGTEEFDGSFTLESRNDFKRDTKPYFTLAMGIETESVKTLANNYMHNNFYIFSTYAVGYIADYMDLEDFGFGAYLRSVKYGE